ncbi:MAG: lipoate--protein ligase family protein, partial [Oscillospiraceae bacterium]
MIKHIGVIQSTKTEPYQNLALEEYLLHHVDEGECILYLWQNRQTVVVGRNQNCWKECKVEELKKDGGYVVRRLSGGGAVFHDLGNLNFTFLVRQEDYNLDRQLQVILKAVQKLGIRAEKSGRNDITVNGQKFSGNAFYSTNGHCYHHGTLLLNVDMENLTQYLNVSTEKLQSKG